MLKRHPIYLVLGLCAALQCLCSGAPEVPLIAVKGPHVHCDHQGPEESCCEAPPFEHWKLVISLLKTVNPGCVSKTDWGYPVGFSWRAVATSPGELVAPNYKPQSSFKVQLFSEPNDGQYKLLHAPSDIVLCPGNGELRTSILIVDKGLVEGLRSNQHQWQVRIKNRSTGAAYLSRPFLLYETCPA